MNKGFYVGTSPFCRATRADCERTPGFVCDGESKFGDGLPCLTGKKVHCTFDQNQFKNTNIYKETVKDSKVDKDFVPEFKWFGTSPYCNESYGSVAAQGYYPVKTDKSGDGAPCVVGEKVLGMKPVSQMQKDEVVKLADEYKKKNEFYENIIKTAIGVLSKIVV